MFVPLQKPRFSVNWRLLIEECIANIGIPLDFLCFCHFNDFWCFVIFPGFWVLANSLLCIMGELAGGWYVAVALAVSDR